MPYVYVKKLGRKKFIRKPAAYFAAVRRNSGGRKSTYRRRRMYRKRY